MATAINAFSNAASMLSLHGIPYAISVCCSYKYNWDSYECVVLALRTKFVAGADRIPARCDYALASRAWMSKYPVGSFQYG